MRRRGNSTEVFGRSPQGQYTPYDTESTRGDIASDSSNKQARIVKINSRPRTLKSHSHSLLPDSVDREISQLEQQCAQKRIETELFLTSDRAILMTELQQESLQLYMEKQRLKKMRNEARQKCKELNIRKITNDFCALAYPKDDMDFRISQLKRDIDSQQREATKLSQNTNTNDAGYIKSLYTEVMLSLDQKIYDEKLEIKKLRNRLDQLREFQDDFVSSFTDQLYGV